jgi:IS30 family transposase
LIQEPWLSRRRPLLGCFLSQAELNKVARDLNERPRKTLDFETPAKRFNARVASTG